MKRHRHKREMKGKFIKIKKENRDWEFRGNQIEYK